MLFGWKRAHDAALPPPPPTTTTTAHACTHLLLLLQALQLPVVDGEVVVGGALL